MALRAGTYRLGTPRLEITKQGVASIQYPVYGFSKTVEVPVTIPMEEWEQVRDRIAQYLAIKFEPSVVDKYLADPRVLNRTTEWLEFETVEPDYEAATVRGEPVLVTHRINWDRLLDDVGIIVDAREE